MVSDCREGASRRLSRVPRSRVEPGTRRLLPVPVSDGDLTREPPAEPPAGPRPEAAGGAVPALPGRPPDEACSEGCAESRRTTRSIRVFALRCVVCVAGSHWLGSSRPPLADWRSFCALQHSTYTVQYSYS